MFDSPEFIQYAEQLENFIILQGEPLQIENVTPIKSGASSSKLMQELSQKMVEQQKMMFEQFNKQKDEWAKREKELQLEKERCQEHYEKLFEDKVGKMANLAPQIIRESKIVPACTIS